MQFPFLGSILWQSLTRKPEQTKKGTTFPKQPHTVVDLGLTSRIKDVPALLRSVKGCLIPE